MAAVTCRVGDANPTDRVRSSVLRSGQRDVSHIGRYQEPVCAPGTARILLWSTGQPGSDRRSGGMLTRPDQGTRDRYQSFFFGRLVWGVIPLGDKIDRVGPADGFLDFGFFGSRLPRFIPLAIIPSCAVVLMGTVRGSPRTGLVSAGTRTYGVGTRHSLGPPPLSECAFSRPGQTAKRYRTMPAARRPRHRRDLDQA